MVNEFNLQAQLLNGLSRILISELLRLLVGDEHKVVLEVENALLDTVLLGCLLVYSFEIDDEALLYAKHGVGGLVRITSDVERTLETEKC